VSRWRFILSARWARYLVLVLVFAAACAGLATWQMARRAEKVAEISRILHNYDASPVPLDAALPQPGSYRADEEWLPVLLTGEYRTEDQLVVRNRPYNGTPGFEVLVPFETDAGRVFLVDRGWVPLDNGDGGVPAAIPEPPEGPVTVVARLKAGEGTVPGTTTATGVLASIHLPEVERILGTSLETSAYGLLASEDPAPADRPAAAPRPEIDEGPHLSYAVQWVVFALLGFGGLVFVARQEYRYRNADEPDQQRRAAARAAKKAGRRTDADEEDALLDAHHR
jgi:cytochrome oxidase assembly protein ShyY1